MSQENVEAVERGYDALRRRDKEAFVRETHPDVEGVLYVMEAEGSVYRGHAGMHRFIDELFSVFPDWHPEVVQATDHGDIVLAQVKFAGRGARSGVALEQILWQVVHFSDGKAIRFQAYATQAEALEAAGLSE
jgi:ketosteroid isomerase-like protein